MFWMQVVYKFQVGIGLLLLPQQYEDREVFTYFYDLQ